ncbi:MAG TPA: glycoside hydrolase family 16 protein [Rickettsiales bacterium]|nr:glycoside hydrolase family 16 protein [Rickettsiales bacterium]
MKFRAILVALTAYLANIGLAIAQTGCPSPQPYSNMTLTFFDTFKNGVLDTSKWTTVAAGGANAINNELQAYIPSGVQVLSTGGLRLQANQQSFWTQNYTSGEIVSRGHFTQTYGRFEMSAKMPNGNGLWPAFWLLPDSGQWPPEIDVLEYIYAPNGFMPNYPNTTSGAFQALHWKDSTGNRSIGFTKYGDFGSTYHTYTIDWRPGSLVYIIDGIVQNCVIDDATTGTRVPSQPMYILANLAIGPANSWSGTLSSSTLLPANMDIRYITAYKFNDLPPAPPLPITVKNITASSTVITPGQTVTLSADVVIGNTTLPGPTAVQFLIYNYDGSQLLNAVNYTGPSSFLANTTYHSSVFYTFSANTVPGIYTFAVAPFWNNWASSFWFPAKNAPPITLSR